MFRNLMLTISLFVCAGSPAFAFESAPLAPPSHAPANGPVARPVDLWIPLEDGVIRRRPPELVSEPVWNKYAKRPSAFVNTGIRVVDPALTAPIKPATPAPRSTRKDTRSRKAATTIGTNMPTVQPAVTPKASSVSSSRPAVQEAPKKTAPTVTSNPVQTPIPQASSQTSAPKGSPPVQTAPASDNVRYPVAVSPPAAPANPPSESPSTGNAPSAGEKVPSLKDISAIYSEPAPAIGEVPSSSTAPSAPQLTASSPNTETAPSFPQTPPAQPRKPSPVRSIAPDLSPDL